GPGSEQNARTPSNSTRLRTPPKHCTCPATKRHVGHPPHPIRPATLLRASPARTPRTISAFLSARNPTKRCCAQLIANCRFQATLTRHIASILSGIPETYPQLHASRL